MLCQDVPALLRGSGIKDGMVQAFLKHHNNLQECVLILVKPCSVIVWVHDGIWGRFIATHDIP
jgi:hypothetical protein